MRLVSDDGLTLDMCGCCRVGENLLNDMAAVSLENPLEARESEIEKAPPLAFEAVVKKAHKWQVVLTPNHALPCHFTGRSIAPLPA